MGAGVDGGQVTDGKNQRLMPFGVNLPAKSSLNYHTGGWRTERPIYLTSGAPCNAACPARELPREWMRPIQDGITDENVFQAWSSILEVNPLPAVVGRVCYHPCQTACYRDRLDGEVGIASLEQFVGDYALERGWALPTPRHELDRRILVIGSGPLGLSAGYQLRRRGFHIEIREAQRVLGGMMRYGIPPNRLDHEVLAAEIAALEGMGIEMHTKAGVRRIDEEVPKYDAVIFAGGGGKCVAVVPEKVLWNQPAHTERRKTRTVTAAIGRGMLTARAVIQHFSQLDGWQDTIAQLGEERTGEAPGSGAGVVPFADLEPWYYPAVRSVARPIVRNKDLIGVVPDRIMPKLTEQEALIEARRCLSCGSCLRCDTCYGVCPENAIEKVWSADTDYRIDLDFCKGCGLCVEECPAGAMRMVPEAR
jgi:Pyruvate/2-oxoacid:ferredoxin oxidoreductase delta subunit